MIGGRAWPIVVGVEQCSSRLSLPSPTRFVGVLGVSRTERIDLVVPVLLSVVGVAELA